MARTVPITLSPSETQALLREAFPDPKHRHSGKSRDSFLFTHEGRQLRLVYTTDRRSIFDMRLGFPIEGIGIVLNAFNLSWRRKLDEANILHDLVASGSAIDTYLPDQLRSNIELWQRAIVVRDLDMIPVEVVLRRYLTGSGWTSYKDTGSVCGQILPAGLRKGERLEHFLHTPTDKAESGHDLPLSASVVDAAYPLLSREAEKLFTLLEQGIPQTSYLFFVDGKAEGGIDRTTNTFYWGDEIGTPDCCRFWRRADYEAAWPNDVPDGYDKEPLRDWGRRVGINRFDPESDGDQAEAYSEIAPRDIRYRLLQRYREVFWQFTGMSVTDFGKMHLGIPPV